MVSKEELRCMYCDKGMSTYEIAKEIDVDQSTVLYWMKKCAIDRRNLSESQFLKSSIPISKKELNQMYVNEKMTASEIGRKINVVQSTVYSWMRKYNIETRNVSEAQLLKSSMPLKEDLYRMYWDEGMSMKEIGHELGVTGAAVQYWMKKHEIEIRNFSEAMINGNFLGEKAGNWKNGVSFIPYCDKFNNKFKEAVRLRDNYTCQLCGCNQTSNKRKLDVHHIHYDKDNCWPDVVTLCSSCNSKVNSNRDEWEKCFEEDLNQRALLNWRPE